MKLTIVAGARPNFLKIAPLIKEIELARAAGSALNYRLVHTGQHYDDALSKVFFDELGIPQPHVNIGAGSGTQAQQTAAVMIGFEQELQHHATDMVIVVGDVNSTLACSIVAKKMQVKVAHIEAGIRSFDMSMPEEVNRIVTDSISDYFFTPSETANNNLIRSGVPQQCIYFVGNIMIDSLYGYAEKFAPPSFISQQGLDISRCLVLTLHRPHNADHPAKLASILETIIADTEGYNIIFPVHPRTAATLQATGFQHPGLITIPPQGYLNFMWMVKHCAAAITDSGGVQEETTVLGVPCITLRNNTERPETVSMGTNTLVGDDLGLLAAVTREVLGGKTRKGTIPPLWDGHTAHRIVKILLDIGGKD